MVKYFVSMPVVIKKYQKYVKEINWICNKMHCKAQSTKTQLIVQQHWLDCALQYRVDWKFLLTKLVPNSINL